MSKSGLGTQRTGIAKQAGNAPRIDTNEDILVIEAMATTGLWRPRIQRINHETRCFGQGDRQSG